MIPSMSPTGSTPRQELMQLGMASGETDTGEAFDIELRWGAKILGALGGRPARPPSGPALFISPP
jgi:hypothetical protein